MKKRNILPMMGLIFLVLTAFTTCENPIIKQWWTSSDNPDNNYDYDYIAIQKDVPKIVYETIIEEKVIYQKIESMINITSPVFVPDNKPIPPEILMQYINIVDIEYIIFSGDSITYNGPAVSPAITNLTTQERTSNNNIVINVENALFDNDGSGATNTFFLILHGHANPQNPNDSVEAAELARISQARADSVFDAFKWKHDIANRVLLTGGLPDPTIPFSSPPYTETSYDNGIDVPHITPDQPFNDRITTKGYGGENNLAGNNSSYAGLNRRVEVILFTVVDPQTSDRDKGY